MKIFDVIIIGKGPSGISAALYTQRANMEMIVIGREGSSLEKAERIGNYYGFEGPVTGERLDFAIKLGVITENNAISVDNKQSTNIEGVFAAGDCTRGFKQISTAVGQGAIAGESIIKFVRALRKDLF